MFFRGNSAANRVGFSVRAPSWKNTQFASQSASFTVQFDAYPLENLQDCVIGLSQLVADDFPDLGVIVRFFTSGVIEARNGGVYTADASVSYASGVPYHFRIVGSLQTHTYSVFVTPQLQNEITLASNYAFRTEQAAVTSLDYLAERNNSGDAIVSGLSISGIELLFPSTAQLALSTFAPGIGRLFPGAAQLVLSTTPPFTGTLSPSTAQLTLSTSAPQEVTPPSTPQNLQGTAGP